MVPLKQKSKISLTQKTKYIHKKPCKNLVKYSNASKGAPQSLFLSGSLTVEAAIALPLFLFAVISVLFFFRVLQITQCTYGVLVDVGSQLSIEETQEKQSQIYLQKELSKVGYLDYMVQGGAKGISIEETMNEDYVNISIKYQCKLPISIFSIKTIPIHQQLCLKQWTGYENPTVSGDSNGEWVYITPNGESYHIRKDCRYLQLDIKTIPKIGIEESSYTPCKVCGEETSLYSYYYVTTGGERYHTRLDCTGLKRTIYIVPAGEVSNRQCCSVCGGAKEW